MGRRLSLAFAAAGSLVWLCCVSTRAADQDAARAASDDQFVTVTAGGRPVLKYRFGQVPFKPYVAELYSPNGVQVLRDSPSDHKHHHALMLALGAGGVDFWSENAQCGAQRHVRLTPATVASTPSGRRVRFTHDLQWIGPAQKEPILAERRTIDVWATADPAATLATWHSDLQPAPGRAQVELSGAHYFGLGVRFVTSMDGKGQFRTDSGRLGDSVRGSERVGPAKWCAYTAAAEGKPVTLALFDSPANPRHPAAMFTMTAPFAYVSATLNLWKQPLVLKADAPPLALRYGIAVWDGDVGTPEIERLYRKWIELDHGP
jgi:hypothetical protein